MNFFPISVNLYPKGTLYSIMKRTKIFAKGIQHLTDARYFSAMGVDWMSFDIRQNSDHFISRIAYNAIKEWVEGPQFSVYSNEVEIENIKIVTDSEYQPASETNRVVELDLASLKELELIKANAILLIVDNVELAISNADILNKQTTPIYLDTKLSPSIVKDLAKALPTIGIVLYGAAEEKVGFKNYDEIDEIIEAFLD